MRRQEAQARWFVPLWTHHQTCSCPGARVTLHFHLRRYFATFDHPLVNGGRKQNVAGSVSESAELLKGRRRNALMGLRIFDGPAEVLQSSRSLGLMTCHHTRSWQRPRAMSTEDFFLNVNHRHGGGDAKTETVVGSLHARLYK